MRHHHEGCALWPAQHHQQHPACWLLPLQCPASSGNQDKSEQPEQETAKISEYPGNCTPPVTASAAAPSPQGKAVNNSIAGCACPVTTEATAQRTFAAVATCRRQPLECLQLLHMIDATTANTTAS
jgi:hypothetical protein